jgi:prepilin-type N-terminal cleavage/methylation domain-containing protein
MSPKAKVQRPKLAVRGGWRLRRVAWCVLRAGPTACAPSSTQHAARTTPRSRAFTLIEIMIVVAIMGIVMAMSVPIVYKVWRKAPMREAVKDIVEVCSHARARAIMQGTVTEVVFHPKENRLGLAAGGSASQSSRDATPSTPMASGSGLSAQLSDQVIIEMLDVNMSGVEFNDADEVKIRFYPNGISDEMRMILFDGRNRMGIELEITTGLANVVPNPLQEWSRR